MKHIIFDAGGVLVYPRLGEWNLPYRAAEILGPERAATIDTDRFRAARADALQWLDEGRVIDSLETERLLRLGFVMALDRRMGWRLSDGALDALAEDFTYNTDRYAVFGDVPAAMDRLRGGHRLGLLSDATPSIYLALERYGILERLDAHVISAEVGATKPSPRMYAAILDRLGAEPGDCLFIDDRPDNLYGAVRAGLHAVQMSRPEAPAAEVWEGPVVEDLGALEALVREGMPE